jgi:hypothetical protein
VPLAIALTTPKLETVATDVFEETQGDVVAGDPEPINVLEAPIQALNFPETVGAAITFTVIDARGLSHVPLVWLT